MEDIKTFNSLVGKYTIVIPHIQRDYVQGSKKHAEKRDKFIESLIKHLYSKENLHLEYIYGSCDENKTDVFYPLDGQQRLTTLFLLRWFLEVRTNRRNDKKDILLYQSRRSSYQFCKKLSTDTFDASFKNKSVSEYIKEEKVWFVDDWFLDPTIKAMMEMLDALQQKLKNYTIETLNTMLNNFNVITFDHLDLKKYNLTDTLYIKMNERGKHLTDFENWKASFIGLLEKKEERDKGRFEQSIEHEWTDMLWTYALGNWDNLTDEAKQNAPYPTIDDSFMNLLLYIHRILFFATATNSEIKASDFSDTPSSREKIFSVEENRHFLFDFLDLWSNIKKERKGISEQAKEDKKTGIDDFFDNLFGNKGVTLWKEGTTNFFNDCISNAKDMELKSQVLFYAISKYCIERKCYTVTEELIRFVRICRNLIEAEYQFESGEVRCNTSVSITAWGKYKNAIDKMVSNICCQSIPWLEGVTEFKGSEHEKDKSDNYNQYEEYIRRWEDNPILKGNLQAILTALKDNSPEDVDAALTAFYKASDTERVQLLVAFGYEGYEVGFCDGYTRKRLFFGEKYRWDVIFRHDWNKAKEAFNKYVSAYIACRRIVGELIKQEGEKAERNTFKYYVLKYPEFIQSNNNTHYLAVKGKYKDLDMISIKLSPRPLNAYHCDPFTYVVSVRNCYGDKQVRCWSIYSDKSSIYLHYTPNERLFAELYSTKDGWVIRKTTEENKEQLSKLYKRLEDEKIVLYGDEYEKSIRLIDNKTKDLIELGVKATEICISWINETFHKK